MRQPFYNIYAFCRTADDLADESPSTESAVKALDDLQHDVDALYAGKTPSDGLFPALADTVATYQLTKRPFDDLISAFRQDQHLHRYDTTEQLLDYCSRSANPVGHLVLQLAGSIGPTQTELSDQICTGLQLANFWQDVARDFEIGRVYLPADARQRHDVTTEMLSQSTTPPQVRRLLAELCDQTETFFRRGLPLADHVPDWLSADIRLFAHGGLETLQAIRRIDYDVLRIRPKVKKSKQLSLVMRAMLGVLK